MRRTSRWTATSRRARRAFPAWTPTCTKVRPATLLREPISARTMLDTDFLTEMRRRATALEAPPGALEWPEFFLQRERDSGVLLGD